MILILLIMLHLRLMVTMIVIVSTVFGHQSVRKQMIREQEKVDVMMIIRNRMIKLTLS